MKNLIKPMSFEERARIAGRARMSNLNPKQRHLLASKAAKMRWAKTPKKGRSEAARAAVNVRWSRKKARKTG